MPLTRSSPLVSLSLSPHVRARECEGQVILLDLRQGRYVGVGHSASAVLTSQVRGWPASGVSIESSRSPAESSAANALMKRLIAQDLLTSRIVDRPFEIAIPEADASLEVEDLADDIELGMRRVARFLGGAARAACRLRMRSLEAIGQAVTDRRSRAPQPNAATLARVQAAAIAYERLRPFVFSARQKCLFDSLALINFLAGERLFPHWVIGVKTQPFGAHSWVQHGSMVLNDQAEHVRRYRPIFVA